MSNKNAGFGCYFFKNSYKTGIHDNSIDSYWDDGVKL